MMAVAGLAAGYEVAAHICCKLTAFAYLIASNIAGSRNAARRFYGIQDFDPTGDPTGWV